MNLFTPAEVARNYIATGKAKGQYAGSEDVSSGGSGGRFYCDGRCRSDDGGSVYSVSVCGKTRRRVRIPGRAYDGPSCGERTLYGELPAYDPASGKRDHGSRDGEELGGRVSWEFCREPSCGGRRGFFTSDQPFWQWNGCICYLHGSRQMFAFLRRRADKGDSM